jgi:hypothetical protein
MEKTVLGMGGKQNTKVASGDVHLGILKFSRSIERELLSDTRKH